MTSSPEEFPERLEDSGSETERWLLRSAGDERAPEELTRKIISAHARRQGAEDHPRRPRDVQKVQLDDLAARRHDDRGTAGGHGR